MATKTPTARHMYRQRSTVWLAVMSGVTGLLLLLSLARNWADYPRPLFGAWVLLGLAVAWSVFVRPAVQVDADGVTLRNIVRDIHVPWSGLTDVTTRWNLKVVAGDQGYNSWAVSSQVGRPKSASGGLFRVPVPGRLEGVRSATARSSMTDTNVTDEAVARSILAAKQEYDDGVARGALPGAPDAPVRTSWVPLVMLVLLLPAIAVVTLTLI